MKGTKFTIGMFAVAASLVFLSCNKQNMQQPPTVGLMTTTANLKAGPTGVLLSDATVVAQQFLQSKNLGITITINNAETVTKNGVPYMHIINGNSGFVILSADSLYTPLLAYNSVGNFDKNNINAGLATWFNKHGFGLEFVRNIKNAFTDSVGNENKKFWMALGGTYTFIPTKSLNNIASNGAGAVTQGKPAPQDGSGIRQVVTTTSSYWLNTIGPLLHSQFTQGQGFNQFCPPGGYGGTTFMPAGCVPVAIAQVMGFWQYGTNPTNGNTYNFSIMPIHVPLGTTFAGFDEAARLIHDIGTTPMNPALGGQFTTYANSGSTSDERSIPYVFGQFGYSSVTGTTASAVQGTDYGTLLTNEIANNQRPCILTGYPSQGSFIGIVTWREGTGHTWVCDGSQQSAIKMTTTYKTYDAFDGTLLGTRVVTSYISPVNLLHMNWGLQGAIISPGGPNNNGWYNANVDYTANPADRVDYQAFQTVTYNIHP